MKETIFRLHEEMEQAIARLDRDRTDTDLTDQSFKVATQYWQRVKQVIRQSGFPDDAAEIYFFKHIKAKFTSLLEYYLLLYRYQVHAKGGSMVLQEFSREEADRMRQFRETHATFIHYYEQGRAEWDDLYFLRRKFNKVQRPASQVYDRATDFWTNGDWILTIFQANYVLEQFFRQTIPDFTLRPGL